MRNTFRPSEPEVLQTPTPEVVKAQEPIKNKKRIHFLRLFDPANYLNVAWFQANARFLGTLFLLAMLYIANAHYSDKRERQINKLGTEVKELRWEYISIRSELIGQSRQSNIAQKAAELGLEELTVRPTIIKVTE
jgi:hypothetical protein